MLSVIPCDASKIPREGGFSEKKVGSTIRSLLKGPLIAYNSTEPNNRSTISLLPHGELETATNQRCTFGAEEKEDTSKAKQNKASTPERGEGGRLTV